LTKPAVKGERLLWGFNGFCWGFVLVYGRAMIPDFQFTMGFPVLK